MFDLTRQEKYVLLFLAGVALAGITISYLYKSHPGLKDHLGVPPASIEAHSKVNINKAGLEELTGLSGIGPELAGRILSYRDSRGGFKSIEEIKDIKGIGDSKFESLKGRITIE